MKMFLKLHDILEESPFFNYIPSKKDETWRFSSLHNYLDKEYQKDSYHEEEHSFIPKDKHWLHIRDGQLQGQNLPDSIHIKQHPLKYEVNNNPFACLSSHEATSPLELICYEDLELGVYFSYSHKSFISSSLNIILKEDITAKLYLHYSGGEESFISHASQFQVQKNAQLFVTQVQALSPTAALISQNSHHLQENATLKSFSLLYSGEYLHNFVNADLHFKAEAEISSILLSSQKQKQVFSCKIEHLADQSKSELISKQVIKDNSTCVFDANTRIQADTHACEATQSSRALLLSESAQIHSKPHLEIYSDDLKASHGTTVGELDKEALSYLCSRGISSAKAKEMLIAAFINELIQKSEVLGFQERIFELIGESL